MSPRTSGEGARIELNALNTARRASCQRAGNLWRLEHSIGEVNCSMSTTTEGNKVVLRRLFDEVINGHDYDVIDDLFAPPFVNHGPDHANTPDT